MTTTPQPIQQQAFSFTPPGTFSQGFGFVPTRLRIDNPSSYYLTFPEVPSVGTITPYTFGVVVPWNQTGLSVTIRAANNSSGAPVLPANNAAVTVLASNDPSLMIQPGISLFQPIISSGPDLETTAGTSQVSVDTIPPIGATAIGLSVTPFTTTGSGTEYTITITDNFTNASLFYTIYQIGQGAVVYLSIPPAASAYGVTIIVQLTGASFASSQVIGLVNYYLTSAVNTPTNTSISPLYVIGPASIGSLQNGEDIVIYGTLAGGYNNGKGVGGADVIDVGVQAATLANSTTTKCDQIVASGVIPNPWSSTTTYIAGDPVVYDGIIYVAYINPPTGTLPTNTSYWIQMTASYVIAG